VDNKQRQQRLRRLIKKLNRERKKQAKKIDILCNDLIGAQRDFIQRLSCIGFAADFYKSVLGTDDLDSMLYSAADAIQAKVPRANLAFFLRRQKNFELHIFESEGPIALAKDELQSCFTTELVENIFRMNRICTLDDLFAGGLQGNPSKFDKLSVATVPVKGDSSCLGFILIYRSSQNRLTDNELRLVSSITPGLSRLIQSLSRAPNCIS